MRQVGHMAFWALSGFLKRRWYTNHGPGRMGENAGAVVYAR